MRDEHHNPHRYPDTQRIAARNITRKVPPPRVTERVARQAEFDVGYVLCGARIFPPGTAYIQARVRWSTSPVSMCPHVLLLHSCLHTNRAMSTCTLLWVFCRHRQTHPQRLVSSNSLSPTTSPTPPAKVEGRERKHPTQGLFSLSFLLFLFLSYSASRLASGRWETPT